jgi:hypothetical protein
MDAASITAPAPTPAATYTTLDGRVLDLSRLTNAVAGLLSLRTISRSRRTARSLVHPSCRSLVAVLCCAG